MQVNGGRWVSGNYYLCKLSTDVDPSDESQRIHLLLIATSVFIMLFLLMLFVTYSEGFKANKDNQGKMFIYSSESTIQGQKIES